MLSASVINSSSQSSRLNWQPSQEANFQTASFGFRLRIILDLPFHQQRSQTAILEDRSIFTDEVWPVLTMSTETNAAFHVAFHREKDAFRRYSLLFQLCCCATHQDFRPADHRFRVGWIECCFRDQFGHIADIPAPRARCVPDDDANFKVEAGAPGFQFTLVEQVRGCVGTAQEDNLSILLPPGKNLIDDRAQRCQPQTSTGQPLPNGPRTPILSPRLSWQRALETGPTLRMVWTSFPLLLGSPLIERGISPTPKTESI